MNADHAPINCPDGAKGCLVCRMIGSMPHSHDYGDVGDLGRVHLERQHGMDCSAMSDAQCVVVHESAKHERNITPEEKAVSRHKAAFELGWTRVPLTAKEQEVLDGWERELAERRRHD